MTLFVLTAFQNCFMCPQVKYNNNL